MVEEDWKTYKSEAKEMSKIIRTNSCTKRYANELVYYKEKVNN